MSSQQQRTPTSDVRGGVPPLTLAAASGADVVVSTATPTGGSAAAIAYAAAAAGTTTERLILFFDYRTLFESADADALNRDAWMDVLETYGYHDLSDATFLRDLVLLTPAEVRNSLSPFVTIPEDEWPHVLKKRAERLRRSVDDMCSAHVLPMRGVKSFLLDCHRCSAVTTVLLSPFTEYVSEQLLLKSNLRPLVDTIVHYSELAAAPIESLEVIDVPPRYCPSTVVHKWQHVPVAAPPACVVSTHVAAFVSSVSSAKIFTPFGILPIGVSFNNRDQEAETRIKPMLGGCDSDDRLLQAGACATVVSDFSDIRFGHLRALLRRQYELEQQMWGAAAMTPRAL